MSAPTMLYKHPGSHEIHGDKFDYTIVDADDAAALSDALESGWVLTTTEAKKASERPSPAAEYIETITDKPKRGRPRKDAEPESITDDL